MRRLGFENRKSPGARLSIPDVLFLAASMTAGASLWVWTEHAPIAWIPTHVALVFLCFCNVFRIGTRQEFAWALSYVATVFATLHYDLPFWQVVFPVSTLCLFAAVAWGAATGRYRGIFHERVAAWARRPRPS